MMSAIPAMRALQLCEKIRLSNMGKWFTLKCWWCWGCNRFSKTPKQRCWSASEENRGCAQVNKAYDVEEHLFRRSS
jgi:hypothetical protein